MLFEGQIFTHSAHRSHLYVSTDRKPLALFGRIGFAIGSGYNSVISCLVNNRSSIFFMVLIICSILIYLPIRIATIVLSINVNKENSNDRPKAILIFFDSLNFGTKMYIVS